MSYLLKFVYGDKHHAFILLEDREYELFCAREGGNRNFTLHDEKYRLSASVATTIPRKAQELLLHPELGHVIRKWLSVSHVGVPLPSGLISTVLDQLSAATLVKMHEAVPFYRSLIKQTLSQRFTEVEILLAIIDDEESAKKQLENTDHGLIPLTSWILEQYPDIWNWECISSNKTLPLDFIEAHAEELYWYRLSSNPALLAGAHPEVIVDKFIDKIDSGELSENPALVTHARLEFLLERYIDDWDWETLSQRLNPSIEIIHRYQGRWNWDILSLYPNLSMELIDAFLDHWNWNYLSQNDSLTVAIIDRYLDRWNWVDLACNKVLQHDVGNRYLSYIEKAVDELLAGVNAYRQSLLPGRTKIGEYEIILMLPREPNPNHVSNKLYRYISTGYLSTAILKKCSLCVSWNWYQCSLNPHLTMEMVEQYASYIDYSALSRNTIFLSQITIDFLKRYNCRPWDWEKVYIDVHKRLPEVVDIYLQHDADPTNKLLPMEKIIELTEADKHFTKEELLGEILSEHKDLTIPFVLAHPEMAWDWFSITRRARWNWKEVLDYPDLPWDKEYMLHKF